MGYQKHNDPEVIKKLLGDSHLTLQSKLEDADSDWQDINDARRAAKISIKEYMDRRDARRVYWVRMGDTLTWIASFVVILLMLTSGAWMPPLMVLLGWSK